MSRKGLSVLFMILLVVSLTACRRGGDDPTIPTPVVELPTTAATAGASVTPVFATATSEVTPQTNTPTPSPAATTVPPTVTATIAPPTMTAIPPTATAIPPTATATIAPPTAATATTTAIPPTATPTALPDTGPPPGGTARIVFAPGATSATVNSNLASGGDTDVWVLRVLAGQMVTVQTISSAPGAVTVSLMRLDRTPLATSPDTAAVSATVPATDDYLIVFDTPFAAGPVSYTAQVFIPTVGNPDPPVRITFAPGATSANVNDTLAAGGDTNFYVLRVGAGQGITVGVFASPPAVTNIVIHNGRGQFIGMGNDMGGAFAVAPAAGDYYIDIISAAGAPAVSYTLTVTVPQSPPPPPQPARIEFGPGEIVAMRNGTVFPSDPAPQYVIRALAGQTLVLEPSGPGIVSPVITVSNAAGATLPSTRNGVALNTAIPATGDYFINLSTDVNGGVPYSLTVLIPPVPGPNPSRIEFEPGANSAVALGALGFGGDVDHWVARASANQTMTLTIDGDPEGGLLVGVYNAGRQFLGYGTELSGLSIPLVDGGDYTIFVHNNPTNPSPSYTLTVDIR